MDPQTPTNSTNIHTIVKAQIVFLLSTLTEDNFERNQTEIRSLAEQHGADTYVHFIRRLFAHSLAWITPGPPPPSSDTSAQLTLRLLVQETQRLARDPFITDRFCEALDKGESDALRQFDLARFVDRIDLHPLERLVLASAVVAGSNKSELVTQAQNIIDVEFENAALDLCHTPSFDQADLNLNQAGKLMANLLSDPPPPVDSPTLDASQRQALIAAVQAKFGKDSVAPMLQRILPHLSLPANATLVQTLVHLGPEVTGDSEALGSLLARFGFSETSPPTDEQVVDMMASLGRMALEGSVLCDVPALVRALSSMRADLNWAAVISSFDWPERHGVDTATLKLLISVLLNSPRDANPHAVTGFWTIWRNSLYQLRLLDALLSLPADTFNFVQLPGRRIVTVDDVAIASPTIKSLAANVQGHTWNSLELFEVLVKLADSDSVELKSCVRDMLDKAIKISAELVHMGLLQVPDPNWNAIRLEYSRKLLAMFLAGHPNHQLVFMRIWQIKPSYLTDAFRDFYNEDPLNITRILDVAQDLKILESLLEVRPFTFALDVAALASRREYLNLDKWLSDNFNNHGSEFLHSVLDFLDEKMKNEKTSRLIDPQAEPRTMSLSPSTITIILRMLRNNAAHLSDEDVPYSLEVRNACLQVHPRLMVLTPGSDIEAGLTVVNYSPEIEAKVDEIYKQMYDENTTIDEVVSMLQRFKDSSSQRDNEIFSCMLHFLFDEYKFFQSYYPARELAMTAYLFGSLIQHSLVESISLGIAIRYILDALQCNIESNLFKFGVGALSRFEFRLPEWQRVCEALVQLPNLTEARPDLISKLQRHLIAIESGIEPPAIAPPEPIAIFSAIQPDSLSVQFITPPEELSDKMLFIVNNLAPSNFDSKLAEMKALLKDDHARWFANYLVDQRISSEPNNHTLYLRFLDALDRKALMKLILHETFVKSVALLNSEKAMQSGIERNTLKNIGSWLGTITLGRDIPIRHKNLSFKELLLEGYDNARLAVAIPYICKVLEGCTQSKVFKPPNPWLMAVMALLAELYIFGELKLNFKFEIEVLCTSLDIELDDIEPTTLVRNRPLLAGDSLAGPPLPDYLQGIDALPIGDYSTGGGMGNDTSIMALHQAPNSADAQRSLGAPIEAILNALIMRIQINAQLGAFLGSQASFRTAVQLAIDRAVREIIVPVVERSVTIAGISTRELVIKDFATDPNEEKLRKAGHLMAQKLAGSLALVTCKDPLKSNMTAHIRSGLLESGFEDIAQNDPVITLLVQDNLELACAAIERAAMDRATNDVDESFASSIEARRRHREARNGHPFWDPQAILTNFSSGLPDPLRIRPNGVQANQLGVYEDFGPDSKRRMVANMTSRPSSTMSYGAPSGYSTSPAPDAGVVHYNQQDAMARLTTLTNDIDAVVNQLPIMSYNLLPPNSDVRYLVRQVAILSSHLAERARTPVLMSQKIVQLLYKATNQLGREVYVILLQQLCDLYEEVRNEAINWLLFSDDDRKYHVPVTVVLLRSSLLPTATYDQSLAKNLFSDPRPTLQNFVAGLIRECVTHDVASQDQFTFCIDVLAGVDQKTVEAQRLIDDLRGVRHPPDTPAVPITKPPLRPETEQVREKLLAYFHQWVNIFRRSSPEKAFVPFVTRMTKEGLLKVEEISSLFFRVCAEAGVGHYMKCIGTGDYEHCYQALDAMARLVALMLKYYGGDASGNNDQAKVKYLTKILSIVVVVLSYFHEEQGPAFQQKPFFRFFASLVTDLHTIEAELGSAYLPLLIGISDAFSSLQPIYFPGFAFSWLCLVSHRLFMPKLLLPDNRDSWSSFHKHLLSFFKFLSPFLKNSDLPPAVQDLYRGALRLLLVLIHDFPDFLSEYYFTLCDAIPPRCIQMRNIILCAYAKTVQLPDPYLPGTTFDGIPEMGPIPPILSDFTSVLQVGDLKGSLEQYLLNRGSASFLPSLKDKLKLPSSSTPVEETYNLSLIDSMVMYIGVSTVAQAKARSGSLFVPSDPGVVALRYLATNLDVEGQHHLLSAAVLHLRYPNAHTHWFSSLLLYLFLEVKDDRFREVMTKVLLERFIGHRPHPWGALVTFIELVRNPKFDFWTKDFINVAPEIQMLLESVKLTI